MANFVSRADPCMNLLMAANVIMMLLAVILCFFA